ncbi:DUF6630 family protein [Chitinophaga nivalis]|uniref:DUF6630 domain-containing protein n=1 Tax=Chitinophaga nivalis TaxID=2991709 RepID=A0ABT3ILH5_9BACT|nr:hypothetical protein [Chitinophaga nivalis]MCW3465491.1 hypothetical protein [Chitinophaga nivalis]MCW3484818.1 hypothetical protein [Chitinophaga nivalis]
MEKHVPEISQADFIWLTNTYGKAGGYSHIDTKESVVHEIFPDKVLIGTAFLNCASYELSFATPVLQIKKNRLDNYKLHDKAVLIPDDMNEEDEEELVMRWEALMQELRLLEKLQGLSNARDPLVQLYLDIFDEEEAEIQISHLPEIIAPNVITIWEELQQALEATDNLAAFEWQEFATGGIDALNALAPLQRAGVVLEAPAPEDIATFLAADDYAKAVLDFVNEQLDARELKIVAIGIVLDEYQTFTCLQMQDFRLANALWKLEELCLVCFF